MKHQRALLVALLLPSLATIQAAEVKFAAIFSDHVVLQREKPVPVWGWAEPGENITVQFGGQKKTAIADANGRWMTKLDPMGASPEPRELVAHAQTAGNTSKVSDVLVGDVWLCSGQSNMNVPVKNAVNGDPKSPQPTIRRYVSLSCQKSPKRSHDPSPAVTGRSVRP